jgi:menaquinone-9 beta-reductase
MPRALIVGGGPAGLACGIRLLELNWDVVVHERHHYPLRKVCGEFLSPAGLSRLKALGADRHLIAAPREIRRGRFEFGPGHAAEFLLRPVAYGLSRQAMDAALADRFRAMGGDLREGSVWTESDKADGDFVDARGRPPERATDMGWHGWKGYLERDDAPTGFDPDLLQMLPIEGGYCGMSVVEDGRIGVCFVSKHRATPRQILDSHPYLSRIADKIRPHAAIAGFRFRAFPGLGLIGDRQRVWPPLVGDGMSRALGAGIAEAERLFRGSNGRRSQNLAFPAALLLHAAMCSARMRKAAGFLPFPSLLLATAYRMTRG